MKATISVNPIAIRENERNRTFDKPVIRVHTYRGSLSVAGVEIDGPSRVVYAPTRKQHGASCFIVCEANDVRIIR